MSRGAASISSFVSLCISVLLSSHFLFFFALSLVRLVKRFSRQRRVFHFLFVSSVFCLFFFCFFFLLSLIFLHNTHLSLVRLAKGLSRHDTHGCLVQVCDRGNVVEQARSNQLALHIVSLQKLCIKRSVRIQNNAQIFCFVLFLVLFCFCCSVFICCCFLIFPHTASLV